ncbi:uncharacterized protein LOC131223754 [Magnolia sinica]|uniref:uncharacterized protein LOC131223754 n=1 Tax=Magnolia sinica TaxID=86752 RepID=UPI00265A027D|nr:uncharacterized protein LOC131223754 [Magnolia sinica]
MDELLIQSPLQPKPPSFPPQTNPNHESLLKESIHRFFHESQRKNRDFSSFRSIFFRLLQSSADPPLEIIWFYAAVTFHELNSSKEEVSSRISSSKDLLQLIVACSASSNGLKCIALLAPVIFELHSAITGFEKISKKTVREIECLVEGIVGYISICSSKDFSGEDGSGNLKCFADLVRVWTADGLDGNWDVVGGLKVFFPLVSDEIRDRLSEEGCGVGYLAGAVTVQAFLLRLFLKVRNGGSKVELANELKVWAVGSITGFRNCVFFDMLMRLLLEPTLPVISLLGSEDESLLREVLYDAVISVDYSFLNPETTMEQYDDRMISLAMTQLIAAHEAIRAARAKGDQNKAISYINAFSRSRLPSKLIKWAIGHFGIEKMSRPRASTPQALLKWLLNLEDQGLRVFVHEISKFRTKLVFDESKADYEHPIFKLDTKRSDNEIFYIDNKGEGEDKVKEEDQEMQSMDTAFMAAARTMKFTANDGRRKRKDGRKGEGKTKVKFLKYKLQDSYLKENSCLGVDGMSSGSDVENPDEDMEEMEQ